MNQIRWQPRSRLVRSLPLILAALPAFIPFYLVLSHGVNMPYWDEWDHGFVDLAIKAHRGELSWADFMAPHNEHRVVVPKLIYLALTWATHWNEFALMFFGWAVACITSINIGILCFKIIRRNSAIFLWFLCNLLIFSPSQWENWLAGYGMINFLPPMFITAAFVVAGTSVREWLKIAILILLATAATFSSLQGFLAWPTIGVLIALPGIGISFKNRFRTLALWIAAFALNLVFYFVGYQVNREPEHVTLNLINKIGFGLAYLGNPFFNNSLSALNVSAMLGLVMILLYLVAISYFVYLWYHHDNERIQGFLIWILIGGFTLATALMAVLFRSSTGMQMAVAGRYVSSTIYLPVALINLMPMTFDDLTKGRSAIIIRLRKLFLLLLTLSLLVIYVISSDSAWKDAGVESRRHLQGKARLLLINVVPDHPVLKDLVYPFPEQMIRLARELDQMGYLHPPLIETRNVLDIIDGTAPPTPPGTFGEINFSAMTVEHTLQVIGWAVIPQQHRPAHAVVLAYEIDNGQPTIFSIAKMGVVRPDVVSKFNQSWYELSGWIADFPPTLLPANFKELKLTAWAFDAETGLATRLDREVNLRP